MPWPRPLREPATKFGFDNRSRQSESPRLRFRRVLGFLLTLSERESGSAVEEAQIFRLDEVNPGRRDLTQ